MLAHRAIKKGVNLQLSNEHVPHFHWSVFDAFALVEKMICHSKHRDEPIGSCATFDIGKSHPSRLHLCTAAAKDRETWRRRDPVYPCF